MDDGSETGDESSNSGSEATDRLTEAPREQIKLGAAYLNGIAIGLFVVGGVSLPGTILLGGAGFRDFAVAFLISAFLSA